MVAKYAYKVKSGKKTVTEYMERTFHLAVSPVPIVPNVPDVPDASIRGVVQMVEDGEAGTRDRGVAEPVGAGGLQGAREATLHVEVGQEDARLQDVHGRRLHERHRAGLFPQAGG